MEHFQLNVQTYTYHSWLQCDTCLQEGRGGPSSGSTSAGNKKFAIQQDDEQWLAKTFCGDDEQIHGEQVSRGEIDGMSANEENSGWGGSRWWSVTLDLDYVCDGMWLSIRMVVPPSLCSVNIVLTRIYLLWSEEFIPWTWRDRLWVYRDGTWKRGSGCQLVQGDRKRQKYYQECNFDSLHSSPLANEYYTADHQAVW